MADSHGLKRQVGWFVSASLVLGTLGSNGLFGNYPITYRIAGPAASFVWIVTMIFGGFLAMTLAYDFTIWPDKAGSEYAPVRIALGKYLGGLTAWGFYVSWGTAATIGTLITGWYIWPTNTTYQTIFTGVTVTVFFIINYFGIKLAGLAEVIMTLLRIVPTIFVGLVAIPYVNLSNFHPFWVASSEIPSASANSLYGMFMLFLAASLYSTWSTYATDIFASIVPEIKDPEKNVPRAGLASTLIPLLFVSLITITGIGVLGSDLGTGEAPLFEYSRIVLGGVGLALMWTALISGTLTNANVAMIGGSRVLYQMALEGDIPKIFAKTNKYGVPIIGLIFTYIINIAMLLYTPIYAILVAMFQVPYMLTIFLLSVANLKIRATKEWHEKAAWKAPWWLIIGFFIIGVLSLMYCWAYGILFGWHDIILGAASEVVMLVLLAIPDIMKRREKK